MDLLGLRFNFLEMNATWQASTIFLTIGDLVAAIGLWFNRSWGIIAFQAIAVSQLVAYLGMTEIFGEQKFLVAFHISTLVVFYFFKFRHRAR